jgi:putative transposase
LTESIAVGSRTFIESVKGLLGYRAKGRDVIEPPEGYQLRVEAVECKAPFGAKKEDMGPENTYLGDVNAE